jgi:hypothetical protein
MALTQAPAELLNLDSGLTISGTTPSLTIGDAGAEDTKIVFDGNAQDYYIGLDDSADTLIIGNGSTVGSSPAITVDSSENTNLAGSLVIHGDADTATNAQSGSVGIMLYADSDTAYVTATSSGNNHRYLELSAINSGTRNDNQLFLSYTGAVGIGTSSPSRQFSVENTLANSGGVIGLTSSDASTSGTLGIIHFGNSTDSSLASINGIADGATDSGKLVFKTEATGGSIEERMRIDSSGRVLIGSAASRDQSSVVPYLQIEGTDYSSSSLGLVSNNNGSTGCFIMLSHNRGSSVGSSTAVNNGDRIGGIWFQAGDGTDINSSVAYMEANIYGDVGSNDTPGLLKFGTTADGSNSPTERMAILPSGGLTFNGDRSTNNALNDYEIGTWTPIWQGLSSNGSTTWATQIGSYTKVGRLVVARFYFGGTWSGNYSGGIIINGLPFTANDNDSWQPIGTYNIDNNGEAVYTAQASGQTWVRLYVTGTGTSWGQLNWSNSFGSSGTTCYLTGTISYFTDQ